MLLNLKFFFSVNKNPEQVYLNVFTTDKPTNSLSKNSYDENLTFMTSIYKKKQLFISIISFLGHLFIKVDI